MLPGARRAPRVRLCELEEQIYTFASRRGARAAADRRAELGFHALGVLEAYLTLWLLLGAPPSLLIVVHRRNGEPADHRGVQVRAAAGGVNEAGTGAPHRAPRARRSAGHHIGLVRKVRILCWTAVGTMLFVQRGLTARGSPTGLGSDAQPEAVKVQRAACNVRACKLLGAGCKVLCKDSLLFGAVSRLAAGISQ